MLAALIEDEDDMKYGAIIAGDGEVIEYHRRSGAPGRRARVLMLRNRTGDAEAIWEYPQLTVALEMYRRANRCT